MNAEQKVLVWDKNPAPPVIHRDGSCPSLSRSEVPEASRDFRRGDAGWLPLNEAERVRGARKCDRCW